MAAGYVPNSPLTTLYTNTTSGTPASPDAVDGAIQALAQTINDNYDAAQGINNGLSGHKDAVVLDHPDQSVTTAKIKDANVTTAKLADGSVTTAKIAAGAVTRDRIATGAVGTNQLDPALTETVSVAAEFERVNAQLADNTQNINGRGINVMYPPAPLVGAVNDGVTDNTAALQAIIDAAVLTPNPWVHIHFPSGTYNISNDLILPNSALNTNKRFLFTGDGPLISKITQTVAGKSIFNIQDLGVAGTMSTFRDLGLGGVSGQETTVTTAAAIRGHLTIGVRVFNCWFTGWYTAIDANVNGLGTGSKEYYIFNNTFEFCTRAINGLNGDMFTIIGNEFSTGSREETGQYQLNFDTCGHIQIIGNKFNFGIGRSIKAIGSTDIQISDNDFTDVGRPVSDPARAAYGRTNIFLKDCDTVLVNGNTLITDVGDAIVRLDGGNTKVRIDNNVFKQSVGVAAIQCITGPNEVEITDNTFGACTFDCIYFSQATLVNSLIKGNKFSTVGSTYLYIKATDNVAKSVTIEGNSPKEKLCRAEGMYVKNFKAVVTAAGATNFLQIALQSFGAAHVKARIAGLSQGSGSKGYIAEWTLNRNSGVTTITAIGTPIAYGNAAAHTLTIDLAASGNDTILSYNPSSASGFSGYLEVEIIGLLDSIILL